jgi:hypothetical protein
VNPNQNAMRRYHSKILAEEVQAYLTEKQGDLLLYGRAVIRGSTTFVRWEVTTEANER